MAAILARCMIQFDEHTPPKFNIEAYFPIGVSVTFQGLCLFNFPEGIFSDGLLVQPTQPPPVVTWLPRFFQPFPSKSSGGS